MSGTALDAEVGLHRSRPMPGAMSSSYWQKGSVQQRAEGASLQRLASLTVHQALSVIMLQLCNARVTQLSAASQQAEMTHWQRLAAC